MSSSNERMNGAGSVGPNVTIPNASTISGSSAAIQTASLSDQSMMTYIPPDQGNDAMVFDDIMLDEDETQFKASLDALLEYDDVQQQQPAGYVTNNSNDTSAVRTDASLYNMATTTVMAGNNSTPSKLPASASALTQRLAGNMVPQQKTQQVQPKQQQQQQILQASSNSNVAPLSYPGTSRGSSTRGVALLAPSQPYKRSRPTLKPTLDYQSFAAGVSEDDHERKRRKRSDRNQREQQRSHRITQQISHLRQILESAQVTFKPDKYSTLVAVAEHIKLLQQRSAMLDEQHKKLLDTITKTGQLVMNNHVVAAPAVPTPASSASNAAVISVQQGEATTQPSDEGLYFVHGLDYKQVFTMCGMALAVASIDGRFMDANVEFERLSGYSRQELLPNVVQPQQPGAADQEQQRIWPPRNLSLFNLFSKQDMEELFAAMSEMLKRPFGRNNDGSHEDASSWEHDYWSGKVRQMSRNTSPVQLHMNITLVRSPHGRPKFFCCALTPTEREPMASEDNEEEVRDAKPSEVPSQVVS